MCIFNSLLLLLLLFFLLESVNRKQKQNNTTKSSLLYHVSNWNAFRNNKDFGRSSIRFRWKSWRNSLRETLLIKWIESSCIRSKSIRYENINYPHSFYESIIHSFVFCIFLYPLINRKKYLFYSRFLLKNIFLNLRENATPSWYHDWSIGVYSGWWNTLRQVLVLLLFLE